MAKGRIAVCLPQAAANAIVCLLRWTCTFASGTGKLCTVHSCIGMGNGPSTCPPQNAHCCGRSRSQLIHDVDPHESALQTPSRSVQPFLHS